MNTPDTRQPMRDALRDWRQHITNGGTCTPGEYPAVKAASASFRAVAENTAQRYAQLLHNHDTKDLADD